MLALVVGVVLILFVLVILVYILTKKPTSNIKKLDDEQQVEEEEENYSNLSQAELESNKERLKNRFVTKATQRKQREQIYKEEESIQNDQEDNEEEEIEEEENPIFQSEEFKKLSIKKQQKLREKQERKEYNEQQKIIKQQKREREEQLSKEYQEKREAKQKEMEQEEKRLKEEKEKKDKAEYDEWRHLFEVEDKGEKEDDINNNEGLLKQFIEHIKTQKVVILEELSAQFSMKTQDVIDRIKSLESDGLLSGILDDRGKFIYITEDEIQGVVDFINQRGRISIFDLAQESNKLIKLENNETQEEINIDEINLEEQ